MRPMEDALLSRRQKAGTEKTAAGASHLPRAGIHRILVCQPSHSLGNSLLLTPLLRELQQLYPGAEVDVLTRCSVAQEIYGGHPNVRRILRLPAHAAGHLPTYVRILQQVRSVRYDLCIDPDAKSRTGRLLLGLARARYKLGFLRAEKHGGMTHGVPVPETLPSKGKRPVYLLRQATGRHAEATFPTPDICLNAAERAYGRHALRDLIGDRDMTEKSRVIGIFANATGPKLLSDAWWNAFLIELEASGTRHIFVEIVPAFARSVLGNRYPAYFSSDLRKLGSVLGALDHFVSLDCGVMHLGSASNARTIAIFTTTRSDQWGPYGPDERIVEAENLTAESTAREVMRLCRATS